MSAYRRQVEELRLRLAPTGPSPWAADALELLGRMDRAVSELEALVQRDRANHAEAREELLALVDYLESGVYAEAFVELWDRAETVAAVPTDDLKRYDDLSEAWKGRAA